MKKALLFLLALLPLMASADVVEIDGINYNLDPEAKKAEVAGGIEYTGDFVIPESVKYEGVDYDVTSIADDAFFTIIQVGENTYQSVMTYITSVSIPKSVVSIGSAFRDCELLESIVIDGENPVYDSRDNCNAIIETSTNMLIAGCKNSIVPSGVVSIGDYAFYLKGLTSIVLPEGLESIGMKAFEGNDMLQSVKLPAH